MKKISVSLSSPSYNHLNHRHSHINTAEDRNMIPAYDKQGLNSVTLEFCTDLSRNFFYKASGVERGNMYKLTATV